MFVIFSKVFSVVLAAIAISKSYVDFRGRKESAQMFLLWTLTWLGIVAVALFPSIVDRLTAVGGGGVGIGTFLGMAIVFLFFLLYRIYVRIESLEQKLTIVVQELSLREPWNAQLVDQDDRWIDDEDAETRTAGKGSTE